MSDVYESRRYRAKDGTLYQLDVCYDQDASNPRQDYDHATVFAGCSTRQYAAVDQTLDYYLDTALTDADYRGARDAQVDARRLRKMLALNPEYLDGSPLCAWGYLSRSYDGTLSVTWPEDTDDDTYEGLVFVSVNSAGVLEGDPENTFTYYTQPWTDAKGNQYESLARYHIAMDIEEYNNWAAGNVFGYVLSTVTECDHGDEHLDEEYSCWGYVTDDTDWLFEDVANNHELEREP